MKLVILGTTSGVPTKERNHMSMFLSVKNMGILIDCGEGTQTQLKKAGISFSKINKIILTHWHGDHVFGLPGLLSSMGLAEYSETLEIIGPKGSKKYLENMQNSFEGGFGIQIKVNESIKIRSNIVFENDDFKINTLPLEHGEAAQGYRIEEKSVRKVKKEILSKYKVPSSPLIKKLEEGKDIEYEGKKITAKEATFLEKGKIFSVVLDTRLCDNAFNLCKDADLAVLESTYLPDLQKKATEYEHMTVEDACKIANESNVKKLVLTHFSPRYKNLNDIKESAQSFFENVVIAEEFMEITF